MTPKIQQTTSTQTTIFVFRFASLRIHLFNSNNSANTKFFSLKNFIFQFFFLIFSSILSYIYCIPSNISLFSIRTFLGNSILILRPERPPASRCLGLGCGLDSTSLKLRLCLSVSDQTRPDPVAVAVALHSDILLCYISSVVDYERDFVLFNLLLLYQRGQSPASLVPCMARQSHPIQTDEDKKKRMMINCLNTIMVCSNICYRRSEKMRNVYLFGFRTKIKSGNKNNIFYASFLGEWKEIEGKIARIHIP